MGHDLRRKLVFSRFETHGLGPLRIFVHPNKKRNLELEKNINAAFVQNKSLVGHRCGLEIWGSLLHNW